jgi:hypothetical protein
MARGRIAVIGDRFTNGNGYTYEKVLERGWIAVHILVAEEKLGRRLREGERATFVDGDRSNLHPDNISVKTRSDKKSPRARLAEINALIQDHREQLEILEEERKSLETQIATL